MQIISESYWETVETHRMTCEHVDSSGKVIERGWGYGFDCDAQGRVDTAKLPPAALANYQKCLLGVGVTPLRLESYARDYRHPMVIRCDCGRRLTLNSGWANQCACGCEYNGSGQELAPRDQWGEETGERF